jgi:hypothetical protein
VRLSDADREALYEGLSRQAAAGQISLEELERRVAIVHGAQTREDVAEVVAELPGAPAGPGETTPPWWAHRPPHGESAAAGADWSPTNERFRDPRSQRIMRVWVDPAGGRHYVPD